MPRAKTRRSGASPPQEGDEGRQGQRRRPPQAHQTARETLMRGLQFAYEHRRTKKREFPRLWIVRINAAARQHGLSYNAFIRGLKTAQIDINRKVLADLAVRDADAFARLAEVAKQAQTAA